MRLKWVEQEFASVPCGKIQCKVFFLWASRFVVITIWFCCLSVGLLIAVLKNMREWIRSRKGCRGTGHEPVKSSTPKAYTLLAECDVKMMSTDHDDTYCIYVSECVCIWLCTIYTFICASIVMYVYIEWYIYEFKDYEVVRNKGFTVHISMFSINTYHAVCVDIHISWLNLNLSRNV